MFLFFIDYLCEKITKNLTASLEMIMKINNEYMMKSRLEILRIRLKIPIEKKVQVPPLNELLLIV